MVGSLACHGVEENVLPISFLELVFGDAADFEMVDVIGIYDVSFFFLVSLEKTDTEEILPVVVFTGKHGKRSE